jgi:hypothetical protein
LAVGSVHTEARHVEAAYLILCEEHDEMAGVGGSAIGDERMTTV